jgi:methylated-DNA-[protein]-cysteine S-methyltransferase
MKAGRFRYAGTFATPLGEMVALVDADGALTHLSFIAANELPLSTMAPEWVWDADRIAPVRQQLDEYFSGRRQRFELKLAPAGTAFQQDVWRLLLEIPYGQTVSYRELAAALGRPAAARAVGAANGANPIAIVIPCHRLLGANGSLTGYAGGLQLKQALLALESSYEA